LRSDHPLDLGTNAAALTVDFVLNPQVLQVPDEACGWATLCRIIAAAARQLLACEGTFNRRIAAFPPAFLSAGISLVYRLTSHSMSVSIREMKARRPAPAHDIAVSRLGGDARDCRAAT
jgi:hypothetical protein